MAGEKQGEATVFKHEGKRQGQNSAKPISQSASFKTNMQKCGQHYPDFNILLEDLLFILFNKQSG